MKITIRDTDRTDGQTLREYRAAQARAWLQRNQKQIRAEFWERKRLDHEGGERWIAAHEVAE